MTNAAKRWDEALELLGVRRCPAARPWWVPGDLCAGAASAHSQQPATETPLEALGSLETFRIFSFFFFFFLANSHLQNWNAGERISKPLCMHLILKYNSISMLC